MKDFILAKIKEYLYQFARNKDISITQRSSDGYLCATDMCKLYEKKFNVYYRLDSAKEFIDSASKMLNDASRQHLLLQSDASEKINLMATIVTHQTTANPEESKVQELIKVYDNTSGDSQNANLTIKIIDQIRICAQHKFASSMSGAHLVALPNAICSIHIFLIS